MGQQSTISTDKKYFIDEQLKGPFSIWKHQHYFAETPGGVEMKDIIQYKIPFWVIGDFANFLFPLCEEVGGNGFDGTDAAVDYVGLFHAIVVFGFQRAIRGLGLAAVEFGNLLQARERILELHLRFLLVVARLDDAFLE